MSNTSNDQLLYQIGVTLLPKVGDVIGKKLVSYCGGAEAVFKEKRKIMSKIPGISASLIDKIKGANILARAEEEIKFIRKYDIQPIFYTEKNYPERLKQCIDSPMLIYLKGNADLNSRKIISFVGTRNATEYGKEICNELISGLFPFSVLIVSGLAYGIDTCAHKAALKNNLKTVAVLGHGLDRIYPHANKTLAERIIEKGGLLTDFMSQSKPDRENFPKRNRIVAGIADAVVVVESGKKGGALITADIANSYNRDVFAVPGKIGDAYSEGCNYLIKTNRSALIQSKDDIIYMMGWEDVPVKPNKQRKLFIKLSDEEKTIINLLLKNKELGIDKICIKSKLNATKVAAALINLEFEGIVKCLPGKVYKLI